MQIQVTETLRLLVLANNKYTETLDKPSLHKPKILGDGNMRLSPKYDFGTTQNIKNW